MAEWFKALVLKTNVFNKYHGFKSHFILLLFNAYLAELVDATDLKFVL